MKKFFTWIGAIVFLGILISTCGNEEVETDKKAEPKTEEKAEVKPTAKPKEKTAEEKAAEEKAAAEEKRLAENQAYRDALISPFTEFNEGISDLSKQSTKLADNPILMMNQEWIIETVTALYQIRAAAHELKAVEPTNDRTKAIQDLMNQIADHYIYVADNYPSAIDNRDVALLESINNEIEASTGKLNEAIILAENLDNPIE